MMRAIKIYGKIVPVTRLPLLAILVSGGTVHPLIRVRTTRFFLVALLAFAFAFTGCALDGDDASLPATEGAPRDESPAGGTAGDGAADDNANNELEATPDAFVFQPVQLAVRSTSYASNTVTVAGLAEGSSAIASAIGGVLLLNGEAAPWTEDDPGPYSEIAVQNGDLLAVELASAAAFSAEKIAQVSIGTYLTEFTVTTGPSPWRTVATMPSARTCAGGASVDGLFYVMGDAHHAVQDFVYDLAGDSWSTFPSMPTRRHSFATVVIDQFIYAIGGSSVYHDASAGPVDVYDTISSQWGTDLAELPTPRARMGGAALEGLVYTVGGEMMGAGVAEEVTVEVYNPALDAWTVLSDMPTPRQWVSSQTVDGTLYAIGGTGYPGLDVLDTVEAYDPSSGTWASKTSIPTARSQHSSTVLNGHIVVIGGYDGADVLSSVEAYDPTTDSWTLLTPMHLPRSCMAVGTVGGEIVVAGGLVTTDFHNGVSATVEVYDPDLEGLY